MTQILNAALQRREVGVRMIFCYKEMLRAMQPNVMRSSRRVLAITWEMSRS
jgi:hypothetical protein